MKSLIILTLFIAGCNGLEKFGNIQKQIVNGYEAGVCQHPHMAYLLLEMKDGSLHACAGSLIDPLHILTAAHCVKDAEEVTVHLGHANAEKASQIIKGKRWAYHRRYSESYSTVLYDVGMIRLEKPAKLGQCVKTISLPKKNEVFTGLCIISGWGLTGNDQSASEHLRTTTMKIIPTKQCKKYAPKISRKQHICVGDRTHMGNNFCDGDSGGPLMCISGYKYVIAGVASYSFDCNNGFGVYANVARFVKWVKRAQKIL